MHDRCAQIDIDVLRKVLKDSKRHGNCRRLFVYSLIGKQDAIHMILVSEASPKNEFN
ncbi:hypothetical protein EMIT0P176_530003 [Pseudomonas sp. IT-P176]